MKFLRNIVVLGFVAAIFAGIFLPVYSDEVGWRFQERAGFDGVDKMFSEACGLNTLARPPFFMMPVRYFSAYLNAAFADPFYVRLSGIFYALLWGGLLLVLIRRIANDARDRIVLGIFAIGLMCLANTPLLLVWSRPEQPLLLTATGALILVGGGWQGKWETGSRAVWTRAIAILLLAIVALSYHLKGLVLLPLFFACIALCSHGRASLFPRVASGALLVAAAVMAAVYWVGRFQCPGDALLQALLAQNNFGAILRDIHGLQDVQALIGKLLRNVNLLQYVVLATPQSNPMSAWLPLGRVDGGAVFYWLVFHVIAWGVAILMAIFCLLVAAWVGFRERRLDPRIVMSLLFLSTALAWSATQVIRNVYEASFILPLVMLAVVFALAAPRKAGRWILGIEVFAAFLGVSALASIVLIANLWGPSLLQASQQRGYIEEQPFSVPVFGYGEQHSDILGAARKCGIPEPERANALLIDDVTYFAFMKSQLPQHRLGVLSVWNGSINDPIAYLRGRRSDGMIVGCRFLSADLRRRAKAQGQFCCLGKADW